MKKRRLIALLLAALTMTAAFTGCGQAPDTTPDASQSTPADDVQTPTPEGAPEENPETAPEKTGFPLAGTWREIQQTEEETSDYIIVDEDGNITTSTGDEWTLRTAPETIEWSEEFWLDYGTRLLKVIRYGEGYVLYDNSSNIVVGGVAGKNCYYYREADYADYDVVVLTTENVADYLTYVGGCGIERNEAGEITYVAYMETLQFKAGLGPHSWALGEITYMSNERAVTIDPATGEITAGEIIRPGYQELSEPVQLCGAGDYSWAYVNGNTVDYAGETHYYFYEVTGAEEIVGEVYVPKGWMP